MTRLAIQGSRSLCGYEVKEIIERACEKFGATAIITSAKIEGTCSVARQVAEKKCIPLGLHFIDKNYGRGKYDRRSKAIQNDSDIVIFIYDGKSKGTAHEMEIAKRTHKSFAVYQLEALPQVGFVEFPDLAEDL